MKEELKNETRKTESPEKAEPRKRKKKYNKPRIIYQAPLEAMAATCTGVGGKVSGVCGSPFS